MIQTDQRCGTEAGAQAHRKRKEKLCDPCRVARNEYMRVWRNAHKETVLANKKLYRLTNKEKIQKYRKYYGSVHKDRILAKNRRRRATVRGNGHTPYTLEQVLEEYGSICYLCETNINLQAPRSSGLERWKQGLHLDHVIPVAKGGQDSLDNVAPTHALCNLNKGTD